MKKKVQQKKEIVPAFQPNIYWEYREHAAPSLEKVDAFLNNFANQLKALIVQDKTVQQNYQVLCQKLGYNVHPSLAKKSKQTSQFPALKNNDYGQKYAIFLNHKIDSITLKLFSFLISNFKLHSIKLSNNSLKQQVQEVKKILDKEDQLSTLYFQWNPLLDCPKRQQVFLATVRPSLQHLILRECKIGNDIVKEILKKIKENNESKLKSLDLYGNDLTNQIGDELSNFIEQNKTLQFLGISKNSLNSDQFFTRLFNSIGQIPLSQQEYELHKQKQKVRDEIIQKNKKRKKGAPEEPIPFVFEVKQTGNGRCYVKNVSLKILNLASNGIKDSSAGLIRKFIQGQGKHLQLFIQGNKFTKTVKQTFKFYQNVVS